MLAGALFVLRAKIRKLFRLGSTEGTESAEMAAEISVGDGTGSDA